MSNIHDKAKELLKDEINQLIKLQDEEIRLGETKTEIIERMARKLEGTGMPPHMISSTIKRLLKENYINVSDGTVERACGETKKQKKLLVNNPNVYDHSSVESSRSESYTKPDGSEEEQEQEDDDDIPPEQNDEPYGLYEGDSDVPAINAEAAEIALSTVETLKGEKETLEIRLKEALAIADNKDELLQRERLKFADLEVELGLMKANPPSPSSTSKDLDAKEELQIKYDELKVAYDELLEVERLRTSKSDFRNAATLPKRVWIAAINAINFHKALTSAARYAIDNNDPWRKILFDIGPDGQLKQAKLEGAA